MLSSLVLRSKLSAVLSGFVIASTLSATGARADEFCEKEIGLKDYSLEADDGALEAANGSRFRLIYWENNEKKTVSDAVISVKKAKPFHVTTKEANNGTGERWMSTVTDYATRVTVKTSTTEIYPRMMGNPAVKEMTFSTMCTSIVSSPIRK